MRGRKSVKQIRSSYKMQINKSAMSHWILFVFLTMPHINPAYLNQIPFVEALIDGCRIASFVVISLWVLFVRRRLSFVAILIIVQQLYILLVTVIYSGDIYQCIVNIFSIFSVVMLYTIGLNGADRKVFISAQLFCFECAIYINLITVLLYPDTMYVSYDSLFVATKNWFLGYYNNQTKYFIPALMFAWQYKAISGKRFRTYLLTAAIFLTAVLMWSGGILVSLFSMAFIYIFLKDWTGVFNGYSCWGIHILFWVFVYIAQTQRWIQWLVGDVLGKWNSFLLRAYLWKRMVKLICEAPILGHGIKDSVSREIEAGFNWAMHAHNMVLEILYQGGLINLFFWIVIIAVAGKVIWRKRDSIESKIIAIAWGGVVYSYIGGTFYITVFNGNVYRCILQ